MFSNFIDIEKRTTIMKSEDDHNLNFLEMM